ncbi:hypothetical protein QKG26_gp100 [Chelonid alphaherpesvirus 5]|uniref:Uncharacterized protein n=1 Tax=Chelonid alphaherpesvirus 5 TaxID=702736 RepID=V5NWT5_9ALPH|nr:hypothetical protein QKG26_gp100 [Chelonid alphaherpesvirus 5]AHA93382.1 hypothetical protein [Chelonid alphaherpesvirus 5]
MRKLLVMGGSCRRNPSHVNFDKLRQELAIWKWAARLYLTGSNALQDVPEVFRPLVMVTFQELIDCELARTLEENEILASVLLTVEFNELRLTVYNLLKSCCFGRTRESTVSAVSSLGPGYVAILGFLGEDVANCVIDYLFDRIRYEYMPFLLITQVC